MPEILQVLRVPCKMLQCPGRFLPCHEQPMRSTFAHFREPRTKHLCSHQVWCPALHAATPAKRSCVWANQTRCLTGGTAVSAPAAHTKGDLCTLPAAGEAAGAPVERAAGALSTKRSSDGAEAADEPAAKRPRADPAHKAAGGAPLPCTPMCAHAVSPSATWQCWWRGRAEEVPSPKHGGAVFLCLCKGSVGRAPHRQSWVSGHWSRSSAHGVSCEERLTFDHQGRKSA